MRCTSIASAQSTRLVIAQARVHYFLKASLPKSFEKKRREMQCYDTLRSLDGLRVGFMLADSKTSDVQLCARQFVDDNIDACLRATNTSVFTRLTSLLYQGINITLVPVNGTELGVWREGMVVRVALSISFRTGRLRRRARSSWRRYRRVHGLLEFVKRYTML